jgi:FixJ family two-component response regulator
MRAGCTQFALAPPIEQWPATTDRRQLVSVATPETTMSKEHLISIVDDDESVRATTIDLIKSMGFLAKAFPHPDDFLNSDAVCDTSCLIADMRMPGMSGLELYVRLVGSGRVIPTILITAFPDERDRARAQQSGVTCYLAKPFADGELLGCIREAIGPAEGK